MDGGSRKSTAQDIRVVLQWKELIEAGITGDTHIGTPRAQGHAYWLKWHDGLESLKDLLTIAPYLYRYVDT